MHIGRNCYVTRCGLTICVSRQTIQYVDKTNQERQYQRWSVHITQQRLVTNITHTCDDSGESEEKDWREIGIEGMRDFGNSGFLEHGML